MSATGLNEGNFSNRIKRLFNIYPNPAQARSKGIFAIGFLIVYLGIVLASANVFATQPAEPEEIVMKTGVNDYNKLSNIFSDSIPASDDHVFFLNKTEIAPQPVTGEKISLMDIEHADTSMTERTLDNCLKQVRLLLKMPISRRPGDRFIFSKFPASDSLQFPGSVSYSSSFYGAMNLLRITKLDLTDTTGNETTKEGPLEEFTKGEAVQVFPNSTTGALNISFTPARNNSRVKIVLIDSEGNTVKEITDSTYDNISTELHVDVSSYKKGIYILQINIDGAKSHERVVVE
jgi:hypothetical protein